MQAAGDVINLSRQAGKAYRALNKWESSSSLTPTSRATMAARRKNNRCVLAGCFWTSGHGLQGGPPPFLDMNGRCSLPGDHD